MNVEELLTLPSAVSWTDKPFTYYVHTIDRSLVSQLTYFPLVLTRINIFVIFSLMHCCSLKMSHSLR